MKKNFSGLLLLLALCLVGPAQSQVLRPLTMEGKTSLYQRVIAVPGARMAASPGDLDKGAAAVVPFTVFYVYARETVGDGEWLQVGTDSDGNTAGWLDAGESIEWKQTLTVGFKDPSVHPRVLFFRDRDSLRQLVDNHDQETYRSLYRQAEQGSAADSPVLAIQPEGFVNIRRNFYLVPILSHEDVLVGAHQGRLLQVASVPLREPTSGRDAYRAGVVFVIDTTISMGPYINSTRATMKRVYDAIEAAGLNERVSFGMVGYRDSTTAVPGLEYDTRIFANLAEGVRGEEFLHRTESVQPATVSSRGFNEDAYAGIKRAIDAINWDEYHARYVILITDAGPRLSGDPLSGTNLNTASLQRIARDNDLALWVMHLRTPQGTANHAFAESEYRRLSHIDNIGDFYYPVETGDVDSFESALSAMTEQLIVQVSDTSPGISEREVHAAGDDSPTELTTFQDKVARLGYALRMRYLQQQGDQSIPRLFNAWIVDRDFEDPARESMDVRVLLTRDQLSDLHEVLRQVLATAEEGTLAPQDFLMELKSLAATISRDPEAAKSATRTVGGNSLADLGYMREYIEGLPYRSQVMNLDLGTWQQWSAQRQFQFINEIDGKIAYYRSLHDNVDLWVSLDGGPVDGDSLYPLLLEALP